MPVDGAVETATPVVLTPIPVLSWVCPGLGHVGVTDSRGVTHDFQGTGLIGRGAMIFGAPRQVWRVPVEDSVWDDAIAEASEEFKHVNFNLTCSHCHYFAASVLDRAGVSPLRPLHGRWVAGATAKVAHAPAHRGRLLSAWDAAVVWGPFLAILALVAWAVLRR